MGKIKHITVKTPKGDRTLTYKSVEKPENDLVCFTKCPYGRVCESLYDPRDPGNDGANFADFCSNLGKEGSECEDSEVEAMVPVEGTIEENLSDLDDTFKQILKRNPMVRIDQVVNKVCSSWCDSYTEDHQNCNSKNGMCIMKDLFLGFKEEIHVEPFDPDIERLEREDREREERIARGEIVEEDA